MENKFCTYKRVGYLRSKMSNILGISYNGVIYASPGVVKHIKNRHGNHLSRKVTTNIIEIMKSIISDPDYIGIYKSSFGKISVEIIKKIDVNILVGIEIDNEKDYIYVSTMYPITDAKIESKLYNGKLIKWKGCF
ncbi:MAG: PBECR2 nuclease fold domain-containing protein [Clostridium sp.]